LAGTIIKVTPCIFADRSDITAWVYRDFIDLHGRVAFEENPVQLIFYRGKIDRTVACKIDVSDFVRLDGDTVEFERFGDNVGIDPILALVCGDFKNFKFGREIGKQIIRKDDISFKFVIFLQFITEQRYKKKE
jgi:hypothetical protein